MSECQTLHSDMNRYRGPTRSVNNSPKGLACLCEITSLDTNPRSLNKLNIGT